MQTQYDSDTTITLCRSRSPVWINSFFEISFFLLINYYGYIYYKYQPQRNPITKEEIKAYLSIFCLLMTGSGPGAGLILIRVAQKLSALMDPDPEHCSKQ